MAVEELYPTLSLFVVVEAVKEVQEVALLYCSPSCDLHLLTRGESSSKRRLLLLWGVFTTV